MGKRLFVDMDGTLAEWRSFKYEFTSLEEVQNASKLIYQKLNEDDYFYNLKPQENVVEAIRKVIEDDNDIEVFILSSVISDKAISDKNRWLDKYLPEIDYKHRIYSDDGKDKKDFIVGGVRSDDFLLDDRTLNLSLWSPPARGIKLLNGQNHTAGTWKGDMINYINNSSLLAQKIVSIVNENEKVQDEQPFHMEQTITVKPVTANVFENEELWKKEHEALKEQYLKILNDENFRALEWYTDLGGHYIFHPSSKEGDWQLSFIDHKGIPTSDSQYKKEDIGTGKLWSDPLNEFPHSRIGKNINIRVLFNNPNRDKVPHSEEERNEEMEKLQESIKGHEDIVRNMKTLGFEPHWVDGFSDDGFVSFHEINNSEHRFGFDGWEDVNIFVDDVYRTVDNFSLEDLTARANGYYGVIEYGMIDDNTIKAAVDNYDKLITARDISLFYEKSDEANNPSWLEVSNELAEGGEATKREYISDITDYINSHNGELSSDEISLGNSLVQALKQKQEERERIVIGSYDCNIIDEWENDTCSYVLGQDSEDSSFFFAQVTESDEQFKGVYVYEYDRHPTKKDVEDKHLDNISAIAIDRHEEEYGADGSRVFPHLNDEPPLVPIREFFDPRNGKILAGDEISVALSVARSGLRESEFSFVHVSREDVYNAVRDFEQSNNIDKPVIDDNGNYEDKDFLYGAYDEYIGISHREELKEYENRFDDYLNKESNLFQKNGWGIYDREANLNSMLAEIYYAKENRLSDAQIDVVIGGGDKSKWDMRAYRKMFEDGKSVEQVNILKKYSSHVVEAINDYIPAQNQDIIPYLNKENLVQDDVFIIADALKAGANYEQIKGVVTSFDILKNWSLERDRALGLIDFQLGDMISELAVKHNVNENDIVRATNEILDELEKGNGKNLYEAYEEKFGMEKLSYSYREQVEAIYMDEMIKEIPFDSPMRLTKVAFPNDNERLITFKTPTSQADVERVFNELFANRSVEDVRLLYNADVSRFLAVQNRENIKNLLGELESSVSYDMIRANSPWGAGVAHIYASDTPQDYIEISVMGYESRNSVMVEANLIKNGNQVIENAMTKELSFSDVSRMKNLSFGFTQVLDPAFREKVADMAKEISLNHSIDLTYISNVNDKDIISNHLKEINLRGFKVDDLDYSNLRRYSEEVKKERSEQEMPDNNITHGEEKLSSKEQMQHILEKGVKSVMDSEGFANWCEKQGRLFYNRYSLQNALLTYFQKPDASYVCGYEKWKDFGRQVKKGAQGIKVYAPVFAKEYGAKGSLFAHIKKQCSEQLAKNENFEYASYRLGQSKLEFIMYKNGRLFDVKNNGKVIQSSLTGEQMRKFLDQYVIGKVPTYYSPVTVFDVKDTTTEVETLWVAKDRAKKSEMVLDENGQPIVDKRGNVKILNSEERKARFDVDLDMSVVEQDPAKMEILYDVLKKVSENRGVPFDEVVRDSDETLKGGANGYYKLPTGQNLHGTITICSDMTPTQKIRTSFHEIAHSDLHQDIEKLANEMGITDKEITRQMKEVQAEAVAYMSASAFGIDTDHKSFSYIANWSGGRELQALQKSMDVIYKESQKLLKDIEKELDSRGLTMGLNVKDTTPLSQEAKEPIIKQNKEFVLNSLRSNDAVQKEALEELKTADEVVSGIIKEQILTTKKIEDKLSEMNDKIEKFDNSNNRQEQTALQYQIKADTARITALQDRVSNLSAERINVLREAQAQGAVKNNLKELYNTDPKKAIAALKKEVSTMSNLDANDLKYLATSKFVKSEYGKLIGVDNERFAVNAIAQLENLKKVASKTNTAVEVNFCEQWSEKPIFENGSVLHPKEANRIVASAEKQIRGFKEKAEAEGDYYPYSKCDITVYSISDKGVLSAINTRIDIGDGGQKDIVDFLEQSIKRGKERMEIVENFKLSQKERPKEKMALPLRADDMELSTQRNKSVVSDRNDKKDIGANTYSMAQWKDAMDNKESVTNDSVRADEVKLEEEREE